MRGNLDLDPLEALGGLEVWARVQPQANVRNRGLAGARIASR
jgi:hypothetical protein